MPPDIVTGRDVELIAAGCLCLIAAGTWSVLPGGAIDLGPLIAFVTVGIASFALAWWDIRTRGEFSWKE